MDIKPIAKLLVLKTQAKVGALRPRSSIMIARSQTSAEMSGCRPSGLECDSHLRRAIGSDRRTEDPALS